MTLDDNQSCYRGDTAETLAWRVADLEQENARLRQENAQLHAILKSVPVHIFTLSQDYKITYLNHFRDDCADQPVGMYVRDFVSETEATLLEAAIDKAYQEQKEQIVCVRSETTGRIEQARYAPLKNDNDPHDSIVVGVTLDVTEERDEVNELLKRKTEVEAALLESDERFRIMVESTPIPVVISDLETGGVLYGNRGLAQIFGTPYETLQEQFTSNFYANPAQRAALLERVASSQPIRGMTMKLKDGTGKSVWAAVYLDRIVYAGQPALLGFFLDVSARKQREEEILRDRRALRRLLDTNERDRRLIAYEIHDGVVQDMTGALMFLQTGLSFVSDEVDGHHELSRGTTLLSNAIGEIRRLLNGLRPLSLEEGGVVAAINDLVTRMLDEDFQIDFQHEIFFRRIAPSLEMAIYRTVQEGVNNARRHSGTNAASVDIQQSEKTIHIKIEDDGCGFDIQKIDPRRCGLSGIHERATLLGGQADIASSPGKGTTIEVVLPLGDYLESDDKLA
ncbi:PAS domain S-box protein [Bremerella sp. JC817]|uniref:PAS domain-containing sensor histidine kinase n=1 Tax=Bremerella sp. JC817 TaxID=3231756 RepID=UPI003458720F